MVNKKKIMIIEDQALLNNMLKNTLSNDYDIVCTCTSAKDMMNLYKKYKPDLILTDVVTKEGANGIEYAKEVKDKYSGISVRDVQNAIMQVKDIEIPDGKNLIDIVPDKITLENGILLITFLLFLIAVKIEPAPPCVIIKSALFIYLLNSSVGIKSNISIFLDSYLV